MDQGMSILNDIMQIMQHYSHISIDDVQHRRMMHDIDVLIDKYSEGNDHGDNKKDYGVHDG